MEPLDLRHRPRPSSARVSNLRDRLPVARRNGVREPRYRRRRTTRPHRRASQRDTTIAFAPPNKPRGLVDPLVAHAASGRPFLGICVGMQMLFAGSEEFGEHAGLGIFGGRVVRTPATAADGTGAQGAPCRVGRAGPGSLGHRVGGDDPERHRAGRLLLFHPLLCAGARGRADTVGGYRLLYNGRRIAAVVGRGNVVECQFHPEKSARTGPSGHSGLSRSASRAAGQPDLPARRRRGSKRFR